MMSYKSVKQIQSHDAAGFETSYTDFSEYSDGYGSKVAHGDLSMQSVVEAGYRDATWPTEVRTDSSIEPEAYDKHPFMSKAQHRLFRAKEARGELPSGTSARWMRKTRNYGSLPERKR